MTAEVRSQVGIRIRGVRIPLTRDQAMLLLMALNEAFLGLDTYLAHRISGTIRPREWIPILFGPTAALILLIAGAIALRRRALASLLATLTFLASLVVGLLGAYFHWVRAILPYAPPGYRVSLSLFVWAPPILGPLAFALVGILGISAAWVEDPPDSGTLILPGGRRLQLPYSKTRAYFYTVGMGVLIALISSVLDHARVRFADPWLWVPVAVGTFGAVVAVGMGMLEDPSPADRWTYVGAMVLLILTGLVGSVLHVRANLAARGGSFVVEQFIRGAPFLAPLLFANVGLLGLIALMDPREG